MAITLKDLRSEVSRLNAKHCKNSKNELIVSGAYGGYQVQLRGKRRKDGKGFRGMGSGVSEITYGYTSAREALSKLHKAEALGTVKEKVKYYDKYGRRG